MSDLISQIGRFETFADRRFTVLTLLDYLGTEAVNQNTFKEYLPLFKIAATKLVEEHDNIW
jgi:hypothetical protein